MIEAASAIAEAPGNFRGSSRRAIQHLSELNTDESRRLLRQIATGKVAFKSSNLDHQAAIAILARDRNECWELMRSSNPSVVIASLNSADGLLFDATQVDSVLKCMEHPEVLVRLRAAEVLATAPSGELAKKAANSIILQMDAIVQMPDAAAWNQNGSESPIPITRGEYAYRRLFRALSKSQIDTQYLYASAALQNEDVRHALQLAIANRGDHASREFLLTIATDVKADMFRVWAINALGALGTLEDLHLLENLSTSDPFIRESTSVARRNVAVYPVREAAIEAIQAIRLRNSLTIER